MTDSEDPFDELLMAIGEDSYLVALDPEIREGLIEQLNARIDHRPARAQTSLLLPDGVGDG